MLSKKRSIVVLLVVVMLVSVLAIPAQAQQSKPVISAMSCKAPGKLTMWVWDDNWAKIIGDSIKDWQTKYCPGAEVDLQVQPWTQYWDLLKTNAAGGELPDVFNMSQDNFGFYAENNAVLDLQPYWDQFGVDTKVWAEGMVGPYRWGDKGDLYAAPVNWDTVAVFYNKDMFDAAGLAYPTTDWTWDDFAADAAKLTDKGKDIYGAAVYAEYQGGYANWIASTGVTPVVDAAHTKCTLGEPGSLEALNFLKDLYDKGYMPSVSVMGGSSADDAFNFWTSGKVAIITAGSWKLTDAFKQVPFNWDIVRLPKNPTTGLSRSILHSVGYVASARTKEPDLAANLILYLGSDEGQTFFAKGGNVAPANPNPELQQMWIDSFGSTKVNIQAFVDASKDSQGVTVFGEIWDKMNTELVVDIFDLGMSVNDTVKDVCDFIDTQLPNQGK